MHGCGHTPRRPYDAAAANGQAAPAYDAHGVAQGLSGDLVLPTQVAEGPGVARLAGAAAEEARRAAEAAIPSPNIWDHPDVYEIENRAVDPDGLLLAAIQRLHPLRGARVLDLGCGSGFHLSVFAELVGAGAAGAAGGAGGAGGAGAAGGGARAGMDGRDGEVVGVEPYPPLVAAARRRVEADRSRMGRRQDVAPIRVLAGSAQAIPLPDASVDVLHARWAYFFGPGCEPGLAEVARVLRPGGTAVVIDNDATTSTFGRWFRREHPGYDPAAVERFWRRRGFRAERILMRWEMADRADFEAVVRIEFSPRVAAAFLAEHRGCGVDYAVNLWWSRY